MRLHSSRRMNLFCVLMGIALLASTAMAQQRGRRSNTPGGIAEGRMMKQKAEELGLSDETLAKIDAALEANAAEEAKIREQTAAAIDGLNEVLAKKLPSEKELMAASNKVGESASKARALKLKSVLEIRSLLTPEQLEKFMEHRQKVTSRR